MSYDPIVNNLSLDYQEDLILADTTLTSWKRQLFDCSSASVTAGITVTLPPMPTTLNRVERGSLFFRRIDAFGDRPLYISAVMNGTQVNVPLDCTPNTVHWFCAVADTALFNNTFYFKLCSASAMESTRVARTAVNTVATTNQNVFGGGYIGTAIEGFTLANGSSLLLTAQTFPKENGVYVVNSAGRIRRRADCAGGVNGNRFLIPVSGGNYAGSVYTVRSLQNLESDFAIFDIMDLAIIIFVKTGNNSLVLDNTTIYTNPSGQLAIKPLGITDNLIGLDTGIVKNYDGTKTYNSGAMINYNGNIFRAIGTTTGGPGRYTNNWCQITAPGDSFGYSDVTIKSDTDYTMLISDYILYMFIDTTDRTITLPKISTMTGTHITNRAKQYIIVKYGFTNTCNIVTDAADSFEDGSRSVALTDNGTVLKLMTIAGNGNTWVRL